MARQQSSRVDADSVEAVSIYAGCAASAASIFAAKCRICRFVRGSRGVQLLACLLRAMLPTMCNSVGVVVRAEQRS